MNFARTVVVLIVSFCCLHQIIQAQTTAFTYQGKLTEGGTAANAQYDFAFSLCADIASVPCIGSLVFVNDVQVTDGIFTVNLDFNASPFTSNTARFLEIFVRPGASTGQYTTLAPRQPITSSPFSVQTIRATSAAVADNSLQLGGVAANQFVQTNDSRLSNDRNPLPNSTNYIQNIPGIGQQTASFNISGGGNANIFNAATQYNIGGNRVLSTAGTSNIIAGVNAGNVNTGANNSFFGTFAGQANTTSNNNSFFGAFAGRVNNTGESNSFFGSAAGIANTTGTANSFFGESAGTSNTTGGSNSFFGFLAGGGNMLGVANSFFGLRAGESNVNGSSNTIIGTSANVASGNLSNATAIGSGAIVSQSNSLVLGSGVNVGIGTTAPTAKLQVAGGNVYIANPNSLIITSPNGACWFITVSNLGVLSTNSVSCP